VLTVEGRSRRIKHTEPGSKGVAKNFNWEGGSPLHIFFSFFPSPFFPFPHVRSRTRIIQLQIWGRAVSFPSRVWGGALKYKPKHDSACLVWGRGRLGPLGLLCLRHSQVASPVRANGTVRRRDIYELNLVNSIKR